MKTAVGSALRGFVLFALVFSGQPGTVAAQDFSFTTNAGTITITRYNGTDGLVTVPGEVGGLPVTMIGLEAFIHCTGVVEVLLPGSITNISDWAFYDCSSLTSINLPGKLISVGESAFGRCASLSGVEIPGSVTSIGDGAFLHCGGLLTISVDPQNANFSSRDGLLLNKNGTTLITCPAGQGGHITVPAGVTNIGYAAFATCLGLTGVTIPTSVLSIEDGAFAACDGLATLAIPTGVTRIGSFAFSDCFSLAEVMIADSVTTLMEGAFQKCISLENVTIPGSVKSIGRGAFAYCSGLTNAVLLPGVSAIGKEAFYECTSLVQVLIPWTVTSIGGDAFFYCTNLAAVYCEGNAPSLGFYAFDFDPVATIYYLPGTTGWSATYGGRPTAPWMLPHPVILSHGPNFGMTTNRFGFVISWAANKPVVIDACSNLAAPQWLAVETNSLAGGASYYSDPKWTNYPTRFYRLRTP